MLALPLLLAACTLAPAPWQDDDKDEGPFSAKTFSGLEWRSIGPALMSGRIADIAVHPNDASTWYVAVGSGNLWKTENAGNTWTSLFEDQGSYSLGCVTLDPSHPDTVWLGTGENVGGRHVGFGDGVYRSRDGGKTWENLGLKKSEHLSKIWVDPRDSNRVFVAAQGPLWSAGGDRGLYRTTDGGANWEKVLGGGEYTGVTDIVVDPRNPDVMYAATHQRYRNVAALVNGGPETGIHKSTDGGTTWRELENGLPKEDMGKIGLAVSPQQPDVIYAAIELAHRKGGFYRSENGGESWEKRSDKVAGGTGPHYYQELYASPHHFDRVYAADVRLRSTSDGGKTWEVIESDHKHVDNHAVAFSPHFPDYLLVGCDGGVYETWDHGKNWRFHANLPVTQFYKVAVDYDKPFYNVYGGTQDNSTQGGPSRTDSSNGIRNADWFITVFADGHQPAVDPTNPDIIYSEWQEGNLVRHDRKTGEIVYIQPQPADGEEWDRFNWDAPILISAHDSKRLYYASQRMWRSDDRGDSWRPVSGDLTRNVDRVRAPMMDRVQSWDAIWDLYAMSKYSTITSVGESPLDEDLIYAGTDDGHIQVSEDGGQNWHKTDSLPGVDDGWFVNDIKADLHDRNTVYAAVDQHKNGDFAPYLFKSTDRGRSWKSIVGNLPERHLVWRLVQDHEKAELLFVGTEFGVFFSVDQGGKWTKLSGGVPNIPFRDLAIQKRENDLVGATFGRGFYILDDYSALREVTPESLESEAALYPVRSAWWYIERRTMGGAGKASQGDGYYVAENPPFGATFTYYLKDDIQTAKEARKEREKDLVKEGKDTPSPDWGAIRLEDLEEDATVILTIRNSTGEVVRYLPGPTKAGIHRVTWDLRYPSVAPEKGGDDDSEEEFMTGGFLAEPDIYTVDLAKRVDGRLVSLGQSRNFRVKPLREGTLQGAGLKEVAAFYKKLATLQHAIGGAGEAIADATERCAHMRKALMNSTVEDESIHESVRSTERELQMLGDALNGRQDRERMGDPGPVSISRRLDVAMMGNRFSTYGPTPTHRMSFDIAKRELADVKTKLDRIVRETLPDLGRRLDELGVPWTRGRSIPGQW